MKNYFTVLFIGLTVISYLILVFHGISKIRHSNIFSKHTKTINIVLLIALPFIWYPLIITIVKPSDDVNELKRLRKEDQEKPNFTDLGTEPSG